MKRQVKTMALPAMTAALLASLAPVPAKSTVLPMTVVEIQKSAGLVSTLTFNLKDEQVFLPLSEATAYLQSLNEYTRKSLSEAIAHRVAKGSGGLFSNSVRIRKLANDNIEYCIKIKEAIRIVLSPDNLSKNFPDPSEREIFRVNIVKFGRAIANSEYTACDILSAIEQSLPPTKTYHPDNLPTSREIKLMISAEHKNLGLSAPEFL
ncbi:iron-sulfur cluster assembly scaffold protein SufA [Photorhabdus sp. CRCIA-P01]|uniref:iron-sulfur cluster assembly scaffold protein SufA n=1 Tax=Photorhabdus sp. CRCIA-P01 TaxID=2019570 RepID=UPI000E5992E2|nr:iron-sulfur cluster assembly scaffold protein SufA [Photorhabdus sp. CRCIA-P01]